MAPDQQALWTQLSTGPGAQAAIATWWANARSVFLAQVLSPSLLPIALANEAASFAAPPPDPSPPPAPNATASWVVCTGVVSVRWHVPAAPPAAPHDTTAGQPRAETVASTLILPTLHLGAAPPASAGITQFPSEFWLAGYDGSPVVTSTTRGDLSITLVSTPVSYTWDFGDGTQATTSTLGLSAAAPITHTYTERSSTNPLAVGGKYQLTVTVTFDTRFQATGPGETPGWVDFADQGLAPLVDTATLPYEVDELYGVLVPAAQP